MISLNPERYGYEVPNNLYWKYYSIVLPFKIARKKYNILEVKRQHKKCPLSGIWLKEKCNPKNKRKITFLNL
jgi:hypothetical protein